MTNTLSKAPNFVQGSPRSRIGTQRYPLLGRVGKGDPLCSNELHQPLCLRRAMPQLIEAILTMNPIINITSPR